MPNAESIYCYHCQRHHPSAEMRQIETKGGKKWRCVQSIQATKKDAAQRDAFGRSITTINRADRQARTNARLNAEKQLAGQ
jgi:hypothetical protein